jgi:hypothetical protein
MHAMDSHPHDAPPVTGETPTARPPEVAEERRELARLIGRLLAHQWLHEQRAGTHYRNHAKAIDRVVSSPE